MMLRFTKENQDPTAFLLEGPVIWSVVMVQIRLSRDSVCPHHVSLGGPLVTDRSLMTKEEAWLPSAKQLSRQRRRTVSSCPSQLCRGA